MKILLVSQVPYNFEQDRLPHQVFPTYQGQTYWLRALKHLGIEYRVFLYNRPMFVNPKLNARLHLFAHHRFPPLYNKYRLAKNRHYNLFISNHLKSLLLNHKVAEYRPDAIIFSGGISELTDSAFTTISHQGIPTILLHGVDPLIGATSFEKNNLQFFNYVITNDPQHALGWSRLGAIQSICLPYAAIDPTLHRKLKLTSKTRSQLSSDVVFVGTLFPDRQQILHRLINYKINIHIYGDIPPHLSLDQRLHPYYKGHAWGKKMVQIYNCTKIALNFVPPHMPTGGNMRTFEIAGCGAFQITNRCPQDWFKPNREIVLYSNTSSLVTKIHHYLAHPKSRNTIAQAGYHKAHQQHTYKHRFSQLLTYLK